MNKKIGKIAITGVGGFIGKKLCQTLENKKYELVKYDLNNLDIRNEIKIPNNIEIVYHLAALNKPYFSKQNPAETFRSNVLGTINLLEAIKNSNVKKIIYASSILVYRDLTRTKETDIVGYNGIYPYGFEKLIGEEYVKIYSDLCGIDYSILRMSGVYGPEMRKNPIFDIIQGFMGGNIQLYVNRDSIYNFIYIDDAVDALVKSLDWEKETVNVFSNENVKIIDIYNFLKEKLEKTAKIKDTESLIKIIGNNEKIKEKNWKIDYPLERGLLETYNYFLNNKNEN